MNAYFLKCIKTVEVGPLVTVDPKTGTETQIDAGRVIYPVGHKTTVRNKTEAARMIRSGSWGWDEPTLKGD